MERSDIDAFVASNVEYYAKKWDLSGQPPSASGFNFAAAFLSIFWMAFRKLYTPLFIYLAVVVVDVLVTSQLASLSPLAADITAAWDRVAPFAYGGVAGAFANKWYLAKFERTYREAIDTATAPDDRMEYLKSKGGVNVAGPPVLFALLAIVFFIMQAVAPTDIF